MTEITKVQANRCVTHHACDCYLYRLQEAERERDEAVALLEEAEDRLGDQACVSHVGTPPEQSLPALKRVTNYLDKIDALLRRVGGESNE